MAIKVYKLFKMYKDGTLHPLFIGKTKPTKMGEWLEAEYIPTKNFAPHGGWHCSSHPVALHIGTGRNEQGKPTIRPQEQVWCECEIKGMFLGEVDNIKDRIVGVPDGYYMAKTNANMHGKWIISKYLKVNRILTDDEVWEINEQTGIHDLPRK